MSAEIVQTPQSQQFTDISEYQFEGNNYTVERKCRFITLYREHGSIYHAAYYTPVSRKTVYNWLESDQQFAEAFADSREDSLDDIESSVYKRAFKSDLLAMFYLKAHRPKFRDKVTVDIEGIKDEINQRMQQLGLRELPALITTITNDGNGNHPELLNSSQFNTPQFAHPSALEQKDQQ